MKINFQFKDWHGDRDGWSTIMVFSFTGDLPKDPETKDTADEEQILAAALNEAADNGVYISSQGGGAGRAFATEPMLSIYKEHLTITQTGGMDV